VIFTTDLDRTPAALDCRHHRAAQLYADTRAPRASLGAYAPGLGPRPRPRPHVLRRRLRGFLGTDGQPIMCVAAGLDARRLRPRGCGRAA
jgi:hypothetical protein